MKILIYQCAKCKQWIYSRARHDFIYCKCKSFALDGGHWDDVHLIFSPERLIGNTIGKKKLVDLNVTAKQLYDDWNNNDNLYGVYEK